MASEQSDRAAIERQLAEELGVRVSTRSGDWWVPGDSTGTEAELLYFIPGKIRNALVAERQRRVAAERALASVRRVAQEMANDLYADVTRLYRVLGRLLDYDREEDGRWIAEAKAIPGAMAYGDTQEDAARKVLEIVSALAPEKPIG